MEYRRRSYTLPPSRVSSITWTMHGYSLSRAVTIRINLPVRSSVQLTLNRSIVPVTGIPTMAITLNIHLPSRGVTGLGPPVRG